MLIEVGPIDAEVLAAIRGLVYSVREWSTARVCRCSTRELQVM